VGGCTIVVVTGCSVVGGGSDEVVSDGGTVVVAVGGMLVIEVVSGSVVVLGGGSAAVGRSVVVSGSVVGSVGTVVLDIFQSGLAHDRGKLQKGLPHKRQKRRG